jgi:uncharacterized phage-associated protein
MVSAHDVANFILSHTGPMSTWKLQKLVYYSQAWHLAWEEQPLFTERIQAWANGPVCPALYRMHRGAFTISSWPSGDPSKLDQAERETVEAVLESYGDLTGRQLSHLTHSEAPWRETRGDLPPTAPSNAEIPQELMQSFYAALDASNQPTVADWGGSASPTDDDIPF